MSHINSATHITHVAYRDHLATRTVGVSLQVSLVVSTRKLLLMFFVARLSRRCASTGEKKGHHEVPFHISGIEEWGLPTSVR